MGRPRSVNLKIVPVAAVLLVLTIGGAGAAAPGRPADGGRPAPDPAAVLDGNLIWNGSFDVADYAGHPLGWSVEGNEGGVNVVNRSAYRTLGLTSLEIADTATSSVSVRSKRTVAVPGDDYTVALDIKGAAGTTGTAPEFTIEFWGMPVAPAQQGPLLGTGVVAPTFTTDWQHVTVGATAPAGTVQADVVIATSANAKGTTYVDDLALTDRPSTYDPDVADGHELFVDDYRIESMDDVGRVVHPATKDAEPLIVADKPWEQTVYYNSVVKPAGSKTYRMFYTCYNAVAPNYHTCLAESKDYVHWTKPDLGLVEFDGSKHNNIASDDGGTITYNPDAPASARYVKLLYLASPFGYHGYTSADGLHWTAVSDQPVLPGGDVVNLAYDPVGRRYVATFKDRLFQSDTPGTYDRSAFISTSTDFVHWTPETLAVSGDVADDGIAYSQGGVEGQIYGMPTFRYGNQYLAMPWNFSITDFSTGQYATAGDGTVTPGLASSRDLVHWDRDARGPVIEPGDPGSWNDGTLYTGNYLKVTDRSVELMYGGFDTGHGGALPGKTQHASIGRAVWRRDGFVSITNGAVGGAGDPGSMTTKPLRFTGDTLHLNAQTQRGGTVEVEVLDAATGKPIPGYTRAAARPIAGDRLDAPVRWSHGGSLAALAGTQVQLRFYLTGASLYSYWFTGR